MTAAAFPTCRAAAAPSERPSDEAIHHGGDRISRKKRARSRVFEPNESLTELREELASLKEEHSGDDESLRASDTRR
jgi:hypothetical protein